MDAPIARRRIRESPPTACIKMRWSCADLGGGEKDADRGTAATVRTRG
jgi:hypothetical protein